MPWTGKPDCTGPHCDCVEPLKRLYEQAWDQRAVWMQAAKNAEGALAECVVLAEQIGDTEVAKVGRAALGRRFDAGGARP